jgi:type 1 glutamine amidotransferase
MKTLKAFVYFLLLTGSIFAQTEKPIKWRKVHVLVYTKNGKGFVHDNIPFAVASIQKLGQSLGFKVDVSDNPTVFSDENLQKYNCLIFTSTNNDVFDTDNQRLAFRRYIESGGGLVGIHAIMGTERNWTWFKQLIGGSFAWHASFQKYKVKVIDHKHPSVTGLPLEWEREDECYFEKELYPTIHTFLAQDVSSLNPKDEKEQNLIKQHNGSFGNYYPAAWHHFFDGGVAWITTLGHDKKDYADPMFVKHILQGIEFVVRRTWKRDPSSAYAQSRDEILKIKE